MSNVMRRIEKIGSGILNASENRIRFTTVISMMNRHPGILALNDSANHQIIYKCPACMDAIHLNTDPNKSDQVWGADVYRFNPTVFRPGTHEPEIVDSKQRILTEDEVIMDYVCSHYIIEGHLHFQENCTHNLKGLVVPMIPWSRWEIEHVPIFFRDFNDVPVFPSNREYPFCTERYLKYWETVIELGYRTPLLDRSDLRKNLSEPIELSRGFGGLRNNKTGELLCDIRDMSSLSFKWEYTVPESCIHQISVLISNFMNGIREDIKAEYLKKVREIINKDMTMTHSCDPSTDILNAQMELYTGNAEDTNSILLQVLLFLVSMGIIK